MAAAVGAARGATLEEQLERLAAALPRSAADCTRADDGAIAREAQALEAAAAALAGLEGRAAPDPASIERLLAAKEESDRLLAQMLDLRSTLPPLPDPAERRTAVRHFLAACAALVDLTGRLRYLLVDAIGDAAADAAGNPAAQERLVALLREHHSGVGAAVMSDLLFDPPADSPSAGRIPSLELRRQILELIALSGQTDLVDTLAELLRAKRGGAELTLAAAETLAAIGLPQDPGPDHDPTLPPVAITAGKVRDLVEQAGEKGLAPAAAARREKLLAALNELAEHGLSEERLRFGLVDVEPGDWLLMRNPSPYNLFTDLAPGLFTHVGVVTAERGRDGRLRLVVVDLPERGARIPATNFDTFVKRTRQWVLLRHRDPAARRAMAAAARAIVGNECQFDLNFRTDRVAELAGADLAGQKVHTYCAGLLLLCALQTGRPRDEFFPLAEGPAGGRTVDNLAQLGLSFGRDFISPSGALFSSELELVGGREPMYEPGRQIEEAAFDHFARRLAERKLSLAPNLFQSLRLKVAAAAKDNRPLAEALAAAANVNADMDLVAAARAAAVIETLDEIATAASRQYAEAQAALRQADEGPPTLRSRLGIAAGRGPGAEYRRRHASLYARWQRDELSPRQLRIALVEYYAAQARRELDARFFAAAGR